MSHCLLITNLKKGRCVIVHYNRRPLVIPEEQRIQDKAKSAPIIKDSGARREFEGGAVRDIQTGKGRCDLLPMRVVANIMETDTLRDIALFIETGDCAYLYSAIRCWFEESGVGKADAFLEVSKHFEDGALKYGERNWEKGIPVHCYIDSCVRHYLKWSRGDTDEPHDRAVLWNLICCIWTIETRSDCVDFPHTGLSKE